MDRPFAAIPLDSARDEPRDPRELPVGAVGRCGGGLKQPDATLYSDAIAAGPPETGLPGHGPI